MGNGHRNFEGFRNPNDIHDIADSLQIEKEIAEEIYLEQLFLNFDKQDLNNKQKELLERFQDNLIEVLKDWKLKVAELMNNDIYISPKIKEFLENNKLDKPTFTIQLKAEADQFLKEVGFDSEINKDNFLVIFNLPKPIAQYWFKGGVQEWGSGSKDVQGMVIEWGLLYRKLMPLIWQLIDMLNESECFTRTINPIAVHNPKKYYYLWEMSTKPQNTERPFIYNNDEDAD